jgi:D-alanine transaminase
MSRIAYVNGQYVPHAQAQVAIEDRGFQFADGVYEVCEVRAGRLVDESRHMARLDRSLNELRIARPMSPAALAIVLRETIRRNRVGDGIAVITVPDIRWQRVDIKSVALLPNVLAKQAARDKDAREAWLVDAQGRVTEGASSNAWIVSRDGKLITHPLGRDILPGITRSVVIDVIKAQGLTFEERAFSVEEAYAAREAFVTSATQTVMPVVSIDGRPVGNGAPGLIASALRRDYHRHADIS